MVIVLVIVRMSSRWARLPPICSKKQATRRAEPFALVMWGALSCPVSRAASIGNFADFADFAALPSPDGSNDVDRFKVSLELGITRTRPAKEAPLQRAGF